MSILWRYAQLIALCLPLALFGCGGGGGGSSSPTNDTPTTATYTVGGTVSGLRGSGLVLQLNGANDLTINTNGTFTFPAIANGSSYLITVKTQPTNPGQTCSVKNSSSTVINANVTRVVVDCSWTKQFGAAGRSTYATGTTTDSTGNVYVVGYTNGNLDGNMLSGTADAYLRKYDAAGTKVFTKLLGVSGSITAALGVAIDPQSSNVYIVGTTSGGLSTNTVNGLRDYFLAQYDSAGNLLSVKQAGVANKDTYGVSVSTDAVGNVYITGHTNGDLGQPLAGVWDLFLVKYLPDGTLDYTTQLGVTGASITVSSVVVDSTDTGVYVTGSTDAQIDGAGGAQIGTSDAFVSKFDAATGAYVAGSTSQLGISNSGSFGNALTAGANGTIYLAGSTNGGAGTLDLFVTQVAGGNTFDIQVGVAGKATTAHAVAVDASGNVYVTGYTEAGLNGNTLTSASSDLFLMKYDSTATLLFTKQLGASGTGATVKGEGVAVDANGDIFVVGTTTGTMENQSLTGTLDSFVAKYSSTGTRL